MIQKKKRLVIILSICVIALSALLIFVLTSLKPNSSVLNITDNPVVTNTTTPSNTIPDADFYANKQINKDYIGHLAFESGLFEFPVLQGESNDTYISTDWKTMQYDIEGSIFMDFRNNYDSSTGDQNLIIYGHYVYADESSKFGPLHQLKDKNNYEKNKYITLEFENEIRRYEVARVFYCQLVDDGNGNYVYTRDDMQYHHTSFEPEYFENYLKAVEEAQFYDTGVSLSQEDHLLTLQTCVRDRDDLRLIVIGKEISRNTIERSQS